MRSVRDKRISSVRRWITNSDEEFQRLGGRQTKSSTDFLHEIHGA